MTEGPLPPEFVSLGDAAASAVAKAGALASDLRGRTFERLTVSERLPSRRVGSSRKSLWRCTCTCGRCVDVTGGNLRSGNSKSCGCLNDETRHERIKHGATRKDDRWREYETWKGMRARCGNPKNRIFKHYGARGIKVCDRWLVGADGRTGFETFISDMGRSPSPEHSIDRIDVNGDYAPSNCRWATRTQQARNTTVTRLIEFRGRSFTAAAWAEITGITVTTIKSRLARGWSAERALTTGAQFLELAGIEGGW